MDLKRIHEAYPEECKDPYVGSKDPSTGTHCTDRRRLKAANYWATVIGFSVALKLKNVL